ncbi:MAG: SDR family oxidoreductase [Myxococcota bacterium]
MSLHTVLITGATAGIGRHLALDLAHRGHRVFATGRKLDALNALAEEAAKLGSHRLETLPLDVTNPENIARAKEIVLERTGGAGVDVLINNAGYGQAGALLEISDEVLREQFETNVFGLMAVTRAFVPGMLDRRAGTVINVSSAGGRFTAPFFGAYHGTKYAVEAMSDALRIELKPFGVRVVLVEPGPVATNFTDRSIASLPSSATSRWSAAYAKADLIRAQTDRAAVGPEAVGAAVRHAIESTHPQARYLVPALRFRLMFALMALTPTWAMDALFAAVFGLHSKKLNPASGGPAAAVR